MAVDGRTLLITFALDFGIGLAAFLIFSILRIFGPTRVYYNPRWYYRTRPGSPLWGDSDTGPAADAPAGATAAAKQHQQTKTRTTSEVQNSSLQQSTQQHPALYQEHSAEQQAAEQQAHQDRPPALQGDAGPAAAVAHAAAAHQGVGQESAAAATSAAAFASGMDDATGLGGVPPFWAPLPPKLPRTILTWIWPLIRMPEASLIDAAGLDVAMLLRFIRFSLMLLLLLSVWCIGVVLPVNLQGNNIAIVQAQVLGPAGSNPAHSASLSNAPSQQPFLPLLPTSVVGTPPADSSSSSSLPVNTTTGNATNATALNAAAAAAASRQRVQLGPGQDVSTLAEHITAGRYRPTDLDKFSLANIPAGSRLLWVHLASVYVVTTVTLALLWHSTSSALRLYLTHLASPAASTAGATHTALLRDIPGVLRGTMLDKVLHWRLFKVLPAALQKHLGSKWGALYGHRMSGPAAAAAAAAATATIDPRHPHTAQGLQHQTHGPSELDDAATVVTPQNVSSNRAAAREPATAVPPCRLFGSDSDSSSHTSSSLNSDMTTDNAQQPEQQHGQVSIVIPTANSTLGGYTTSESTRHRRPRMYQHEEGSYAATSTASTALAADQQQRTTGHGALAVPDPAAAGASTSAVTAAAQSLQRPSDRAAAPDVLSAHQQRVLHGEWERAAVALRSGMSLQDFITQEFTQVYGKDNIAAVHLISYSRRTAKLVQQYNSTKSALQDLLDHYSTQLQHAAAASHRQQQQGSETAASRVLASAAKPFKALGRALALIPGELPQPVLSPAVGSEAAGAGAAGRDVRRLQASAAGSNGGSSGNSGSSSDSTSKQRHHGWMRHSVVKPIEVLQLPWPTPPKPNPASKHSHHQEPAPATLAAPSATLEPAHSPHQPTSYSRHRHIQVDANKRDQGLQLQQPQPQPQQGAASPGSSITQPLFTLDSFRVVPSGFSPPTPVNTAAGMPFAARLLHSTAAPAAASPTTGSVGGTPDQLAQQQLVAGAAHVQGRAPARSSSKGSAAKQAVSQQVYHWPGDSSSSEPESTEDAHEPEGGGRHGCCGRGRLKGDALEVLLTRLALIRSQLSAAQAAAEQDPHPAALITFRTRTALAAAVGTRHVAEASAWTLSPAPPPDGLLWSQLGLRSWQVGARKAVVRAVLVVVALFYVFPVGAVQGLLQLTRLERAPVIGTLVSVPVVRSLLTGVLPGLALRIFVLLLPVLLYALNRRAGAVGQADMDGHVATQFFTLQVVTVFLASFITGSLLNQLALLVTNPQQVLTILGTNVPQTANFFMLYIIFSAFVGRSWSLLRPWGLLMTAFRLAGAKKAGSRGRRRAVLVGTYRMFGPAVPQHSIILLLSLVFCVIHPFVLLCGLVFFAMTLLVETYNWGWVFRRPYEGGGELWKQVFRHVIIALYVFQLVMIALLAVKLFVWTLLLLIPLLCTVLVHRIGARFLQRSWGVMSVKAAHELDMADAAIQQQQQVEQQDDRTAAAALQGVDSSSATGRSGKPAGPGVLEGNKPGSLSAAWGELYRSPGQCLLLLGPSTEQGLAQQVAAMQQRLAEHNAVAAGKRRMSVV